MSDKPVPQRPEETAGKFDADLDDEDDEPGVQYASSSHPGMVAVVRRSSRGRRSTSSGRRQKAADNRARQIRLWMLAVIFGLIIFDITGHRFSSLFVGIHQVFRPLKYAIANLHLEVVALVIAAAVLIYLTPGVEESVLRALGIKRTSSRRR